MENNRNSSKYVWGMVMPIIIMVIVQNIVDIFLVECLMVYNISTYTGGTYINFVNSMLDQAVSTNMNTAISIGYSVICIFVLGYLYFKDFSSKVKMTHPFRGISDNPALMVVGLLVFGIGLQYLCIYLMNSVAIMKPDWMIEYQELLDAAGLTDETSLGMGIYAVLLAPICEELAFRGLIFKNARKIMPPVWAIVIQGLLFAAFHMNWLQASYTVVVGIGLGYIMYRYDNLLVPIILHMIFNVIGTFFEGYMPMGGDSFGSYFLWFLGSLIVSYCGLLILQKAAPGVKIEKRGSDN